MGVNISIVDADFKDIPDWDCFANGGARDIFSMLGRELPVLHVGPNFEDYIVKPADFTAWRQVFSRNDFSNHEMWVGMVDRLEADASLSISVSY
jgi:hypothetical protein